MAATIYPPRNRAPQPRPVGQSRPIKKLFLQSSQQPTALFPNPPRPPHRTLIAYATPSPTSLFPLPSPPIRPPPREKHQTRPARQSRHRVPQNHRQIIDNKQHSASCQPTILAANDSHREEVFPLSIFNIYRWEKPPPLASRPAVFAPQKTPFLRRIERVTWKTSPIL